MFVDKTLDNYGSNRHLHADSYAEAAMHHSKLVSIDQAPPSLGGASEAGIWVGHTTFYGRSIDVHASSRFPAKNPGARAFPGKISLHKLLEPDLGIARGRRIRAGPLIFQCRSLVIRA